jgi:hypothetical protein
MLASYRWFEFWLFLIICRTITYGSWIDRYKGPQPNIDTLDIPSFRYNAYKKMVQKALDVSYRYEVANLFQALSKVINEQGICIFAIESPVEERKMTLRKFLNRLNFQEMTDVNFVVASNVTHQFNVNNRSTNVIGCTLSHLRVMEMMISMPHCNAAFVMEDDIKVDVRLGTRDVALVLLKLLQLDKHIWDIQYPGWCMEPFCHYHNMHQSEINLLHNFGSNNFYERAIGPMCTHALVYTRRFAQLHIDLWSSDEQIINLADPLPIDHALARTIAVYDLNAIRPTRRIFSQRTGMKSGSLIGNKLGISEFDLGHFFVWKVLGFPHPHIDRHSNILCELINKQKQMVSISNSYNNSYVDNTLYQIMKPKIYLIFNSSEGYRRMDSTFRHFQIERSSIEQIAVLPPVDIHSPFKMVYSHSNVNQPLMNYEKGIYTHAELSLLATYYQIVHESNDTTIIVTDDILLIPNAIKQILKESKKAPKDWDVLQFFVDSFTVRAQLSMIREPFIKWMPEYNGTSVVLISSNGLRKLRKKPIYGHLVSEFWLFSDDTYGIKAYTHTENLFDLHRNTYQLPENFGVFNRGFQKKRFTPHEMCGQASILAMTVTTGRDINSLQKNLDILINSGINALVPINIEIAVVSPRGVPNLIGKNIYHLYAPDNNPREEFSKWPLIWHIIQKISIEKYDFAFIFDDDQSYSAFPWTTLLCRINSHGQYITPVIVGLPRESLRTNVIPQDTASGEYFITTNGDFWRNSPRWGERGQLKSIESITRLTFIEMNNAFINTTFLKWYFNDLASNGIINLYREYRTDWGVDSMWCGAARQWSEQVQPCAMVPLPVWHLDKGSLTSHYQTKKAKLFASRGHHISHKLVQNVTYSKWMKFSARLRSTYVNDNLWK